MAGLSGTRRWVVAGVALVAAVGLLLVAWWTGRDAPTGLDLVVAPHPDDELQAWGLVADDPSTHRVFAFLTRGEETSFCAPELPGLDAAAGEWAPDPRPTGRWTPACADARIAATVAFLEAMGADDPGLPTSYRDAGSVRLDDTFAGVAQRCDDGTCGPGDDVRVLHGDGATLVFFDLGDGDLSVEEVHAAVDVVVRQRDLLGIPDLPPRRLVAASFFNDGPGCVSYPHPDHRAARDGVRTAIGTGFTTRWSAACAAEGGDLEAAAVDEETWARTFALGPDGRRIGPHPRYYGWLLEPYWPDDPDAGSQDELFHRDQRFLRQS